MAFVIGAECIDVLDNSCTDVCPVDCIYTGVRKNYINAEECIDCAACVSVCPVDAIYSAANAANDRQKEFVTDSLEFFELPLPGRDGALGNVGGSLRIGAVGVDTERVRSSVPDVRAERGDRATEEG